MIYHADEKAKEEINNLISGGTVERQIHEDITYDDIHENYDLYVHGGFTYSRPDLLIKDDSWFLGWDYGHCWDYSPYLDDPDLKKWTTDELIDECYDVIAQLVKIDEEED